MLAVSKPRPGPGIELVDVPRPVLGGGRRHWTRGRRSRSCWNPAWSDVSLSPFGHQLAQGVHDAGPLLLAED